MGTRPTVREVDKRLIAARDALEVGDVIFANPAKAVGEIYELGLGDSSELRELILGLIDEIAWDDYTGTRPPQRSYESAITDCELWAFAWESERLRKPMYLKFALKNGLFYLVSIHKGVVR